MADELALEPAVNRPVVPLNVVVKSRCELVGVKHLNGSLLPSGSNRLAFSKVDLHMHHLMRERFQFGIIIGGTVKNEISRLQVSFLQALIRQQVELVRLVPLA